MKISPTAGLSSTGESLKENLLTNSGWGLNSGATFETQGSDLVTNGNFGSDTSGWTAGNSATLSVDGLRLLVTRNGVSNPYAYQDITTVAGKLYKLSVNAVEHSSDYGSKYVLKVTDTSNNIINYVPEISTSGGTTETSTFVFEATASTSRIRLEKDNNDSGGVKFDACSCYEVVPGYVASDTLAPDGWARGDATLDLHRIHNDGGTLTKDGSFYSLKVTKGASGNEDLYFPNGYVANAEWTQRFAGRTVTFGCWVKSISATDNVGLIIYDGVGTTTGSILATADAWTWIELTRTMDASATQAKFQIRFYGDTSDVAYISQPMLVFGKSIGEGNYTSPSQEIIWADKNIPVVSDNTIGRDGAYTFTNSRTSLPTYSPAAADDQTLGLTQMSGGRIPHGCRAVYLVAEIENSTITSDEGIRFGKDSNNKTDLVIYPSVNAVRQRGNGWVRCDTDGNIYQEVTEAGATLSSLYVTCTGVQLA